MPVSKWDFSSRDWLRSDASSDPEQFKQSLIRDSKFFFKPGQLHSTSYAEESVGCFRIPLFPTDGVRANKQVSHGKSAGLPDELHIMDGIDIDV